MDDRDSKAAKGAALARKLFAGAPGGGTKLPARLREYTFTHLFGDVWQGEEMSLEERSFITCAALVAMNRGSEQRMHFVGARNLGIPRAKMEGMITHLAHYAGWPCAASALAVLNEVWPEQTGEQA